MKKLLFLSLIFFFSCQKEENISVVSQAAKTEDLSKIEELELSGIKLYKKELQISDASGKNKATLLVAAENESDLETYLSLVKFDLSIGKADDSKVSGLSTNSPIDLKNQPVIYHEIISESLSENFKAYGLLTTFKEGNKNARLLGGWSYRYWYESGLHASAASVEWLYTTNNNNGIHYAFEYKNCGLCGWGDGPNGELYAGNPSRYYAKDARKLGVYVDHNWNNLNVNFSY